MQLLAVYLVLIVMGDFIAYGIGTAVQQVSEAASLPIFLALYFFVFFIAWVIAVRLTEPRKTQGENKPIVEIGSAGPRGP